MARPAHDYARVDKHVPVTRRAETANPYSPVMILLSLIATLGILFYAQFLLNPSNRGDLLPYVAGDRRRVDPGDPRPAVDVDDPVRQRRARGTSPSTRPRRLMFDKKAIKAAGLEDQPHLWPIMLDGKRDRRRRLHHRLRRGRRQDPRAPRPPRMAIKGKHRTWILDDGRSDEVRALAAELGCHYVRRLSPATAPRPATSTTRCRSPRVSSSRSSTPTSCPRRTSCSRPCRSS